MQRRLRGGLQTVCGLAEVPNVKIFTVMKKVAIIGAGFVGSVHAAACDRSKLIELAAVCDVNENAGKAITEKFGCPYFGDTETMLEELEIDIADICVPTFLHKKNILLAA